MQEKQTPDIVAATAIFRAVRTLSDASFFEAGGWREESHQCVAQAIRDHARARCVLADAYEVDWTFTQLDALKRSRHYDLCLLYTSDAADE